MARNYDRVDLRWGWKGDYLLDNNGDLLDTYDNQIEALEQEVVDICRSTLGDWEFASNKGANLEEFVGAANTRETAQKMHKQLFSALVEGARIAPQDLAIKIIPLNHESVTILIAIAAQPTQHNTLEEEWLRFTYVYTFGSNDFRTVGRSV